MFSLLWDRISHHSSGWAEFTLYTRMNGHAQRPSGLRLPRAGIKGEHELPCSTLKSAHYMAAGRWEKFELFIKWRADFPCKCSIWTEGNGIKAETKAPLLSHKHYRRGLSTPWRPRLICCDPLSWADGNSHGAWEALVSRLFSAPTLERVEGSRAALWCPSGSTLSRYAEYYGILGSFGIKMVGKERKVTCSF